MNRLGEIQGHNDAPKSVCTVGKISFPQQFRDTKGLMVTNLEKRNVGRCPVQNVNIVCRTFYKLDARMKHIDSIHDRLSPQSCGKEDVCAMGAHIKQLTCDEADMCSNHVLSKEFIREESISDISSTIDEAIDVLRHPHLTMFHRGISHTRGEQLSAPTLLRRKKKSHRRAAKRELLPASLSIRSLPRELEFHAQDESPPASSSSIGSQLSVRSMPLLL